MMAVKETRCITNLWCIILDRFFVVSAQIHQIFCVRPLIPSRNVAPMFYPQLCTLFCVKMEILSIIIGFYCTLFLLPVLVCGTVY